MSKSKIRHLLDQIARLKPQDVSAKDGLAGTLLRMEELTVPACNDAARRETLACVNQTLERHKLKKATMRELRQIQGAM